MQGVKFPIAHLWGVIFIHVFSEFLDLPWTLYVGILKKMVSLPCLLISVLDSSQGFLIIDYNSL